MLRVRVTAVCTCYCCVYVLLLHVVLLVMLMYIPEIRKLEHMFAVALMYKYIWIPQPEGKGGQLLVRHSQHGEIFSAASTFQPLDNGP